MKLLNVTNEKLKVAIYIRVSSDEQVEKFGIPLQKEAILGMIKSRGENMVLAGDKYIYIDGGVSGTVDIYERPAFARLVEDVTLAPEGEKPFDAVAVYKIDRFARKLKILLEIIDFFEDHSVKFMSANEMLDTSTPFGRAMLSIIGVIAELERDTIVDRTNTGKAHAAKQGIVMGSNAPYGYEKDDNKKYKVLPEEAEVVVKIFEMFTYEFRSPDNIAKKLTESRTLSPAISAHKHKKSKREINKKNEIYFWLPETITRILRSDIYGGQIYTNKTKNGKKLDKKDWVLSPVIAPQIIDPVTFAKAQELLSQEVHQKKIAKDGHTYLLSGLLKCDCCHNVEKDKDGRVRWSGDRKEIEKNSGRFSYYYKCGRKNKSKSSTICPTLPLPAGEIDNYILNFSRKLLSNPRAVFNYQTKLKSNLVNEKSLKQKELDLVNMINATLPRKQRILEQHEAGLISSKEMKNKVSEINENNHRYQKELNEVKLLMGKNKISKDQIKALELFSEKYKKVLEKGFEDKNVQYIFVHELIEEIVIYSRDLNENDKKLPGRRSSNQKMPYKLHIKLKLPEDIMNDVDELVRGTKTSLVGDTGLEPVTFAV